MLRILVTICASVWCMSAYAQNAASATATQTIKLELYPAIDLKFSNNNTSAPLNMAFNTTSQYTDGIVSGGQELTVQSNKDFKISVMTAAPFFSYSGSNSQSQNMPVNNTLFMSVLNNNTGGLTASAFNNNYTSLSASSQDIIINGQRGENKKVELAYKAKPAMGFAAGTYSVDVVYTATQP